MLILAGDISDDQSVLRSTFELVVQKFNHVFFVPGNHDLWVRRKERDLLDSLGELLPCPARGAPSLSISGVLHTEHVDCLTQTRYRRSGQLAVCFCTSLLAGAASTC